MAIKLRLALVAVIFGATVGVVVLCFGHGSGITIDAYKRIEVGMTRQQVEEILGGPYRNESAHQWELYHTNWNTCLKATAGPDQWWGPDIIITISFDAQDKVCGKNFKSHYYGP